MRVLLTEGSGLTSRQVAGQLAAAGHEVGVLSSDPLGLTRFTRATRRWHRVPPFGTDPVHWLDTALDIYREHDYQVLYPTQEQVTVLAAARHRLDAAHVATAVPSFCALEAVQDKIAAHTTLQRLGLPQPEGTVVHDRQSLAAWSTYPVWAKTPIGTASSNVRHLDGPAQRDRLLASPAFAEALGAGGVLLQAPATGPLVMAQALFDHGRLIAFHANTRAQEGPRGGASAKTSFVRPAERDILLRLGAALEWHGALSADLIDSPAGPVVIDINPRLVEPGNALASGTDLAGALLALCVGEHPEPLPLGREGVNTHQLLLAVLAAAERPRARRAIASELHRAATHHDVYRHSREELLPLRHDWRSAVPLAAVTLGTLVTPGLRARFAADSVDNYALTPDAWRNLRRDAHEYQPDGG